MAGFTNDIANAENGDFSGDFPVGQSANILKADGELWIGSTALNAGGTHINVGKIVSPDSSIDVGYSGPNITIQQSAASSSVVVSAYLSANMTNVTGDGTSFNPIFDSTYVNTGGSFNTTTGVFTAPSTGNYAYQIQVTYSGVTPAHAASFIVAKAGGVNRQFSTTNIYSLFDASQGTATWGQSGVIPLTASLTIDFALSVTGSTKTVSLFAVGSNGFMSTLSIFKV